MQQVKALLVRLAPMENACLLIQLPKIKEIDHPGGLFTWLVTPIILTILVCISGIWYFRKMEKTFADVI